MKELFCIVVAAVVSLGAITGTADGWLYCYKGYIDELKTGPCFAGSCLTEYFRGVPYYGCSKDKRKDGCTKVSTKTFCYCNKTWCNKPKNMFSRTYSAELEMIQRKI